MKSLRGGAALAAAVVLWSSFALTVRGIGASGLTPADAAMLRFAVPVLLLAPWLPRAWRAVRREPAGVIVALGVAGLPHFLLSALGGSLTTAAVVGLLLPGSVPLFLALILAVRGDRGGSGKNAALGAIVAGIAVLTPAGTSVTGIGVLLAAGCAWAVYTLALRHTRLDLISVVLVICTPSAAAALLLGLTGAIPSALLTGAAPPSSIVVFAVLQGVGTGIFSTLAFAYAVRKLGSSIPAVTGALSPVLTTVLAVPLFAEPITLPVTAGLVLVVGGVIAFNLTGRRRNGPDREPDEREAGKTNGSGYPEKRPLILRRAWTLVDRRRAPSPSVRCDRHSPDLLVGLPRRLP